MARWTAVECERCRGGSIGAVHTLQHAAASRVAQVRHVLVILIRVFVPIRLVGVCNGQQSPATLFAEVGNAIAMERRGVSAASY